MSEYPSVLSIEYPDEQDDNLVEIGLEGCSVSLVNAIRRTIMNNVETVAVGKVEIEVNTGIVHDDQLSHRFEFLPLRCCGSFGKSSVDPEVPIGTFECSGYHSGTTIMNAFDCVNSDVVVPVYDCELNQLFKGQHVKGKLYAEKGCGEKNAKFSPVSFITFVNDDPSLGDDSKKWTLKYESMGTIEPAEDIFFLALKFLFNKISEVQKKV